MNSFCPMEIVIVDKERAQYCKTLNSGFMLEDEQMAGELIMNCRFSGIDKILIYDHQLPLEFFQLETRLAGNILQKFSTYDARLYIVGDYKRHMRKSLVQFIHESNKIGRVNFVLTEEEAIFKMDRIAR